MLQIISKCARAYSIGKFCQTICSKYNFLIPVVFILLIIALIVYWKQNENKDLNKLRDIQFRVINGFENNRLEGFANIKVGSNSYKVHEDLENPNEAAIRMDRLNIKATKLINFLMNKYVSNSNNLMTIKDSKRKIVTKGIKSMKKNFKSANMEENIPERSGGDTSYVIDKGDVFAMCLRDPKKNNKLQENENDLTFVLIHELAHLFTSTFGHDNLFWNNFNFLLQEATLIDVYKPVDYKKTGSPYCGIVVTYSPLFDKSLQDYHL